MSPEKAKQELTHLEHRDLHLLIIRNIFNKQMLFKFLGSDMVNWLRLTVTVYFQNGSLRFALACILFVIFYNLITESLSGKSQGKRLLNQIN